MFREWGKVPARVLDEREQEFEKKVDFALHHFDVGHISPPEPEVPASIRNSINVETMIGSVVQQDTRDSSASVTINFATVREAVDSLDRALSEHPAPQDIAAEIKPELETIRAQLAKPRPSVVILREAGSTLRGISEGVAGALLAPHVQAAIVAFLSALGLQQNMPTLCHADGCGRGGEALPRHPWGLD